MSTCHGTKHAIRVTKLSYFRLIMYAHQARRKLKISCLGPIVSWLLMFYILLMMLGRPSSGSSSYGVIGRVVTQFPIHFILLLYLSFDLGILLKCLISNGKRDSIAFAPACRIGTAEMLWHWISVAIQTCFSLVMIYGSLYRVFREKIKCEDDSCAIGEGILLLAQMICVFLLGCFVLSLTARCSFLRSVRRYSLAFE